MWRAVISFFFVFILPALAQAGFPDSWFIRGNIVPINSHLEIGHYEVGLYSSLGGDGLPNSFPLVQQILPHGRINFELRVPSRIPQGYLFAEFVAAGENRRTWIVPTANPWNSRSRQRAELFLRVLSPPKVEVKDIVTLTGTVGTIFSAGGTPLPQADVLVKVRGRKESARTDASGTFQLRLAAFRGSVSLELLKPGYHPSVFTVKSDEPRLPSLKIASRSAVEQLARKLNVSQEFNLGVVMGQAVSEKGDPLPGFVARLSQKAEGPFYFDQQGQPSNRLRSTTSDGRFFFLNVPPGTAFLDGEIQGESIAPLRISTIGGGELLYKTLIPVSGSLSGRLLNAVGRIGHEPIAGARIRVEGSADWTISDFLGSFRLGPMRWFRGEKISLMFSAAKFHNHRYQLNPQLDEPALKLYAFPADYLESLARTMGEDLAPDTGMVIGRTRPPSLRIDALADHSENNQTKDFYFDSKGRMRAAPAMTDPRFGTYLLLNVPSGHNYLQGSDSAGALRFSRDFYAGPNVVNVEVENSSNSK